MADALFENDYNPDVLSCLANIQVSFFGDWTACGSVPVSRKRRVERRASGCHSFHPGIFFIPLFKK